MVKIAVTRFRAGHSMLGGCVLGVWAASFSGGCTRELAGLKFELLPGDAATDTSLTPLFDAARVDAQAFASATADAGVSESQAPDTQGEKEAGVPAREAGAGSIKLPAIGAPDAATVRDLDAAVVSTSDAGGGASSHALSSDAGVRSERWVFQAASPFESRDGGLGLVTVLPARDMVVDGSTAEWSDGGWLWIATPDMAIGEPNSERDLSAALAARWDATRLYLAVTVSDEHHVNDSSGFDIWGGDSIQVAFDVGQERLPYDWEYGFAHTSRGLVAHRWRDGDADVSTDIDFAVVRHSGVTVYEVAFEARHLGLSALPASTLRLSVAVNDNDGQERTAALELVQGIVGTKSAERFPSAEWK